MKLKFINTWYLGSIMAVLMAFAASNVRASHPDINTRLYNLALHAEPQRMGDPEKKEKRKEKKYQRYLKRWNRSIDKSDRLYERGTYNLCYGRARWRIFWDKRRSTKNALYVIDIAKLAKYLDGKGEYKNAIAAYDSSLALFNKYLTPDSLYYKKAMLELAEVGTYIGRLKDSYKLLKQLNDSLIPRLNTAIEGKMPGLLDHYTTVLDDSLVTSLDRYNPDSLVSTPHQVNHDSASATENNGSSPPSQLEGPKIKSLENDSALYYKYSRVLMTAQLEMGHYQQASMLLEDALRYQERITRKKLKYTDPETGKKVKLKISRKELKQREFVLAELYFLQAKIAEVIGNYPLADSLLQLNKNKRIKEVTSRRSPQYFKNSLALGNLKEELEQYEEAEKIYDKTRRRIKRTNKVSGYGRLFGELKTDQARNYINLEDFRNFRKASRRYTDATRLKYRNNNPYFFDSRRIYYEGLYFKNPRATERKVKRLYNRMNEVVPGMHISRIPYNELLYKIKRRNNEYAEAKELLRLNAEIYKEYYGKSSPAYHESLLKIADFAINYENNFNEADSLFKLSFDTAVTRQLHPFHPDYYDWLMLYSDLFEQTDRFDDAIDNHIKALAIINKKFDRNNKYYGIALEKLGGVMIKKGNFGLAENLLERAVEITREEAGKRSLSYINTLRTLAELYSINGKYEDAEKMIKRANRLSRRLGDFVEIQNVASSEELAQLYIQTGEYDDAEDILTKVIEMRSLKYGSEHFQLIKPNNLLGQLYLLKGDFVQAEKTSKKAMNISNAVLSDTSVHYLENLELLANVYTEMGDLEEAEMLYSSLIDQNKKMFGPDNIKIVDPTISMAKVKIAREEDPTQIYAMLDNVKGIVASDLGTTHHKYAEIEQLQAINKIDQRKFDEAQKLLESAKTIWVNKFGTQYIQTADNVAAQARLSYEKGEYERAIELYDDALKLYRKIFSKEHPKYVSTQGKLARTYYAKGEFKDALKIFETTTEQYLHYINNYFPALSQNQKAKYWNSIRGDFEVFNSLAINYMSEDEDVIETMYNYKIATKAILLSSSIKVRERILNSGDDQLIEQYNTWVEKKEMLTRAISMSKEELETNNINVNNLEKEISEIEKSLSEKSEAFATDDENRDIDWKDVQDNLKENESAVEMVRFRYFDTHLTDSVIYAALIVNEETKKQPGIVILNNGNQLEDKYFKYYRNVIQYKTTDKYSYEKFWKPIDDKIPQNHTVILSPDGIYNQLNVETFQDEQGNYMIDKHAFYLVSNTKDIVIERTDEDEKDRKGEDVEIFQPAIVLFGNPAFSEGSEGDVEATASDRVIHIDPLPGAEEEVKNLQDILNKNNWRTSSFIGIEASEPQVKKMQSPRVFHVATHGFFIKESNIDERSLTASAGNPLLKSGLLFSGSAELINEQNVYNLNRKDGILTAYEAMNLSLDNTELVVLSACETGLGEIKAGEGVFGLQRAFLVAGAQNVIMSLFKVNDQATQELMNTFYEEWLSTGNKREAFTKAKNQIREKYDAPIYWGSFIMIGLDD